jgi:cell division protein FtsA
MSELAVGLDIGSTRVRLVALSTEGGLVRYRTHAEVASRGWHRGQIADQTAVAATVRQVVEEAERRSEGPIGSAVVGVGGPWIRSQQGRGVYDFGHKRRITKEDLAYAVRLAAGSRLDEDRVLLQVLPQDFTVDGQAPMLHPLNVECLRLEAHALLITAPQHEHQALLSAVQEAHLRAEETIFEAMAASYASVLEEERTGGVAVLDIGRHSTGLVYYDGDAMVFAIGMPLSAEHFTRDISELKALSVDEAERVKVAHGCALLGLTADNIIIELPAEGGRTQREISRRDMNEILEARAVQLFQYLEKFRVECARELSLHEGVVLCGGGALLEGMVEVAERVMGCPARLGFARGIDQWPDELATPEWTTAAGLAMYSARLQGRRGRGGGPSFWGLFAGRPPR